MTEPAPGAPSTHRRAIAAWVLYDWAYGAFTTIVSTFVIATYFTQAVARNPVEGASHWAAAQTVAGILIALLSVPLGAIADQGGRRRQMLAVATAIMVACTLGLWFVRPIPGDAMLALTLVVAATVAFEIATVFYNAMLPALAPPGRLGRLSMLGWGAGYAGGLVCLVTCLVVFISPAVAPFGLDRGQSEQVRATALFAGVWLALFAWPACVFIRQQGAPTPWGPAIARGVAELRQALRDAARQPGCGGS